MTATTVQGLAGFCCFFATVLCLWSIQEQSVSNLILSLICIFFTRSPLQPLQMLLLQFWIQLLYTDHNVLCSAGRNSTANMYHNCIDSLCKGKSCHPFASHNPATCRETELCLNIDLVVPWSTGVGWQRFTYLAVKLKILAEFLPNDFNTWPCYWLLASVPLPRANWNVSSTRRCVFLSFSRFKRS